MPDLSTQSCMLWTKYRNKGANIMIILQSRTFQRFSLPPLSHMKVNTCMLSVYSNIPDVQFSLSQRHCRTVVSLSVLPESHATEHRWVYSTSPRRVWPLAPHREIPYQSFTDKPESPSGFAVEQLNKHQSGQIDTEDRNRAMLSPLCLIEALILARKTVHCFCIL